jgi:hypothetical protein
MTFKAAFFKGTHAGLPGIYNRAVRLRGRGPYSHVELVFSDGMAASSSYMDGGVRFKQIDFSDGNWDFVDLPAAWEPAARQWFTDHLGKAYDLMGNVFLAVGFFPDSADKYFCSEAAGAALGIHEPFRFEPNTLYPVLVRLAECYQPARASA